MRSRVLQASVFFALAAMLGGADTPKASEKGPAPATQPGLVVHEWGVHVRHATASGGELGPATALVGGLPDFVGRFASDYTPRVEFREWAKPVIHFYGREGAVKVRVGTPLGQPTVYWPRPDLEDKIQWRMGTGRSRVEAMTWEGRLSSTPGPMNEVDKDHWWQTARSISSLYFVSGETCERFIFYEATARTDPPVTATVSAETLVLRNADSQAAGRVLVIVNDGARLSWKAVEEVPAAGSVKVGKDELLKTAGKPEQLLAEYAEQWKSFGMTAQEAQAIVAVWKEDLIRDPGFLLISRMPPAEYEKMFPLKIEPQPKEIVRVGMVFDSLGGQSDRLSWLPELNQVMDRWAKDLNADEFNTRQKAFQRFAALGDLAKPYLEKLLQSKALSPEVSNAATGLLEKLKPPSQTGESNGSGAGDGP